jgi:hypothetical protein
MPRKRESRRGFLRAVGSGAAAAAWLHPPAAAQDAAPEWLDPSFLITGSELDLKFEYSGATRSAFRSTTSKALSRPGNNSVATSCAS